jgi:hypothetical protein
MGPGPRVRDWVVGFGEGEETYYHGRRLAPPRRFAFFALGGRHPRSMTHGPRPPCQGLAATFGGDEEARWFAPRVAVRLLRTRILIPKEDDSWARAPVSEAGPLLSAEMKRCGGSLLAWRLAFFAH